MPNQVDPESVGISFVDLLYAVPVAALATRVSETHLKGISASGLLDIALALIPVTLGWIGHHTNRLRKQELAPEMLIQSSPFSDLRFLQFWSEVLVIVAYFALSVRLKLSTSEPTHVETGWKASWLLVLFGLYVVWDVLDVAIASKHNEGEWKRRAEHGLAGTLVFLLVFGVLHTLTPVHANSAWPFDGICIGALFLYRWFQAWLIAKVSGDSPATG